MKKESKRGMDSRDNPLVQMNRDPIRWYYYTIIVFKYIPNISAPFTNSAKVPNFDNKFYYHQQNVFIVYYQPISFKMKTLIFKYSSRNDDILKFLAKIRGKFDLSTCPPLYTFHRFKQKQTEFKCFAFYYSILLI